MQTFLKALFAYSFFMAGALMFYYFTFKSLRDGKAKTRYGESSRQAQPVSFWFTVVAGILVGCGACFMAVFILIHPFKIW